MDRDGHLQPAQVAARDRQAAVRAVAELDPVVDVDHAGDLRHGLRTRQVPLQPGQGLVRQPFPVVLDGEREHAFRPRDPHPQQAVPLLFRQAVLEGVLQDRLQDQAGHPEPFEAGGQRREIDPDPVAEPHRLDFGIDAGVVDFLRDIDFIGVVPGDVLEVLPELLGEAVGVFIVLSGDLPTEDEEAVVEEVRIDLRLQLLEFGPLGEDLLAVDLVDQDPEILDHPEEVVLQIAQFIGSSVGDRDVEVAALDPAEGADQVVHGLLQQPG